MPKVTFFENTKTVGSPHFVQLDAVLQAIKNGKYRDKIESIRGARDEETASKYKSVLPCVLYAGEFSKPFTKPSENGDYITYREDRCLTTHSGFVPIDMDNIDDIN